MKRLQIILLDMLKKDIERYAKFLVTDTQSSNDYYQGYDDGMATLALRIVNALDRMAGGDTYISPFHDEVRMTVQEQMVTLRLNKKGGE